MIAQRTRLDEQLLQMETLCNDARKIIQVLEPLIINVSLEYDLPLNIEVICQAFDESKANRKKNSLLENQCQSQAEKIAHLENQLENISKDLAQFIRSSGSEDSIDFLRKQSILDTQKSLKEKVTQKRGIIQSNIGLGAHFDKFM
jgi:hypothetical protein